MTLQCATLRAAYLVLDRLRAEAGFEVLIIKNRLMLAFDPSATGGYRDLCAAPPHDPPRADPCLC